MVQSKIVKLLRNLVLFLFIVYLIWWIVLQLTTAPDSSAREYWADTYGCVALVGSIAGFLVAKKWGGFRTYLGKSTLFFSFGLLAQVFGQLAYTYYFYKKNVEAPYPSIGDIGYFGSIPLYIFGAWYLAKTIGIKVSFKQLQAKVVSIVIPAIILIISYISFLRDYDFAEKTKLVIFLDYGYPLGQAIYVSIALVAYLLSRKWLGGVMKNKIQLILFALAVQYVADYNFLYQIIKETWQNGGYGDMLYLTAYLTMSLGLIYLGSIKFTNANSSNRQKNIEEQNSKMQETAA